MDLRPLLLLVVLYGVIHWLPFGIFGWIQNEDGLLEWGSVALLAAAAVHAFRILRQSRLPWQQQLVWGLFLLICVLFIGEEISWGERLHGFGIEAIRRVNTQGETNLHNLGAIQKNHLLHLGWAGLGLTFGSANWLLRTNPLLPDRQLSLYFLIPGFWYLAFDLTRSCSRRGDCPISLSDHQEIYEFLISLGILLHTRRCLNRSLAEMDRA